MKEQDPVISYLYDPLSENEKKAFEEALKNNPEMTTQLNQNQTAFK